MKTVIAMEADSDQRATRSVSEGQAASLDPSLTRRVTRFCGIRLLPVFLTLLLADSTGFAADKPVHLFILSGQSNMQGMDPETGFLPEANTLFKGDQVVSIKVAKGGQPICRWLEEWTEIAAKKGS